MKTEIIIGLLILIFSVSFVLNIIFYTLTKIHKSWSEKFRNILTEEIAKGNISADPLIDLLWDTHEK
jgi:hypothetical protein